MNTVKDKTILVTGGGQGLGAAICRTLAEDGANVVSVDIKSDGIEQVSSEIREKGGSCCCYVMDVSDVNSVDQIIEKVIAKFGRLDVVINNAGVDFTKPIEELTHDEWNKVINVNLTGPFIVSKAAYPHMVKNQKGHIINIASTAAKRAWANASVYHASKWGLLGFSHSLHVEARKNNIKVTALVAGGMQTAFILERFPEVDPDLLQDPRNVADTIKYVLNQPDGSVIPEVMVLPMRETSWP